VHWILTGVLIAASAATVAFAGYLMRRLFSLRPGTPDTPDATDAAASPSPVPPQESS
jgi:hypothetical protein